MTQENAAPPVTQEDDTDIRREHAIDTLHTYGYVSGRVASALRENTTTLSELKAQGRLFTPHDDPVTYFETIGINNEHLSDVSCDERRPDLDVSAPKSLGTDHDANNRQELRLRHIGYMYRHLVYATSDRAILLLRHEKNRKAVFVHLKKWSTTPSIIDMLFNVLDRGDKPADIYDIPPSSSLEFEEEGTTPTMIVFEDRIRFRANGNPVQQKSAHRFLFKFEKGSSTFGYLKRITGEPIHLDIAQSKEDYFDTPSSEP